MAIALAAALTGCAGGPAPRADQLSTGRVDARSVAPMVDCLSDGFRRAHGVLVNVHVEQERRAAATRVESTVNASPIIYVDVGDDGSAVLVETSRARFMSTSGEREAFSSCLARYSASAT